jgi:type I restriction-modification system DNA methylase subunit
MTRDELKQLEADLWSAADNLRANSDLKSSEYSTPVLGLIFLKFADNSYRRYEAVSEEYKLVSSEVAAIAKTIELEINKAIVAKELKND